MSFFALLWNLVERLEFSPKPATRSFVGPSTTNTPPLLYKLHQLPALNGNIHWPQVHWGNTIRDSPPSEWNEDECPQFLDQMALKQYLRKVMAQEIISLEQTIWFSTKVPTKQFSMNYLLNQLHLSSFTNFRHLFCMPANFTLLSH